MGSNVLSMALSKKGFCNFKCTYPKDFNDPYELFLTIDFQQDPELLATYKDTIGEIPQYPTTCFSKSPGVIPMWAHYAHNHTGVVIEVNESILSQKLPDIGFGDIDYRDAPDEDLLHMLKRACHIGKPRYHFLLQQGVQSTAYYTKHTCWSYEEERRLVAGDKLVNVKDGIMLLEVPVECISSLIVGNSSNEKTKSMVQVLANEIGADFYEMKIGKTNSIPFYINSDNNTYHYDSGSITECANACKSCGEPLLVEADLCSWCTITEHHEDIAARRNPLRMFQEMGQLEQYYKDMSAIGRNHDKK